MSKFSTHFDSSIARSPYKPVWLVSVILCLGAIQLSAQVTGSVFRDFNGNVPKDANEPLVSGVLVSAYLANLNTLCGTATYIVRIFNAADNCFTDVTVTASTISCACPTLPCAGTTAVKN
jgi:hypothetical protein